MRSLSIAMLILFAAAAELAYAHAELESSIPTDKAMLSAPLKEVVLDFSEAVNLTALSIERNGEAKKDLGPLPTDAAQHFAVAAPSLSAGQYMINWRALSDDAHVVSGTLHFTVGASH